MKISQTAAQEKFTVVVSLGFAVFVLSWLYGLRDFKNPFTFRGNFCTGAWNPEQYGLAIDAQGGRKWTQECALAAADRRSDIFFFGALAFVLSVLLFFIFIWNTQDDDKTKD